MNNDQRSHPTTKSVQEQISSRAEILWKAKGSPSGRDEEIWLEAERQLSDEARETPDDSSSTSQLSSEEPAMPPEAVQKSSAAEHMTTPARVGGSPRRRSSNR